MVATVTAAVVLTAGTAIPAVAGALASVGITAAAVAKATFVGGMTVGAMGVAGKAVSDITNDEVSDMDEYTGKAAKDAFAGALCGALLSPAMMPAAATGLLGEIPTASQQVGTLLKISCTGGVYRYTYYDLRERMDGRTPSIKQGLGEFWNGVVSSAFMYIAVTAILGIPPLIKDAYKNNVKSGAEGPGKVISEANKAKINGWKYPPSDDLYLKYKDVYDNPKYFDQITGDAIYPGMYGDPNIGGFTNGIYKTKTLTLGQVIDRYGSNGTGQYFSPGGSSFESRALPPFMETQPYTQYEVLKPFEVKSGEIAPWFGKVGKGIQYYSDIEIIDSLGNSVKATVQTLIDEGYIRIISH